LDDPDAPDLITNAGIDYLDRCAEEDADVGTGHGSAPEPHFHGPNYH